MRTIYVSPEFPLNRRMRKDVRRGKLQVVREGENLSMGRGNCRNLESAENDTSRDNSMTLNEKENAIDYLAMAIRFLTELPTNSYAWKWVLISLHGAIYGFAVCAARLDYRRKNGDIGSNVLTKKGYLHDFDSVIKKCESEWMGKRSYSSSPLGLSHEQRSALRNLKESRNRMEHFTPATLSDAPDGKMVKHCLQVAEAIALGMGTINWESMDEKKNIMTLCATGIKLARNYILDEE